MSLLVSERKWFNKTIAAYQHHWLANFRSARTTDSFVRGIARATGLPASTIRKSLPFKNFRAAQRDGKSYLAIALKNIRAAFKAGTWRKNYLRAFGGAGAAARPKRKKRKTKKKKKATKKKGGKKKIYGTKSAAKKAASKGRYPYKVKGGWSLSKKAKKKKSTKKRSTKKKDKTSQKGKTSRKKKYPTKAEAKKAASKGRYPYKVKGGWSLSKKR